MKRIFSTLLISAMLFSFAACSNASENDESLIPDGSDNASIAETASAESIKSEADEENTVDRYLAKWRESELEVVVSDTFNDGFYIGLVPEIERPDEESKAVMKAKLKQRANDFVKANPIESVEYTFDGVKRILSFQKADIRETVKTYYFNSGGINVAYDFKTMTPVALLVFDGAMKPTIEKNLAESKKVVNSADEAVDCVKQYCRDAMKIDDIDDFDPSYVYTCEYYKDPPFERYYSIELRKVIDGILVSHIVAEVKEHFGASFIRAWECDKETADFYTACARYALSDEVLAQAEAALIRTAAKDENIIQIKDIRLWNTGNAEDAERHNETTRYSEDIYDYAYDYCGRVQYYNEYDKTGVQLQYTYTAVMADGTEKPGCNVVTVFIPVDWAEEFGEK